MNSYFKQQFFPASLTFNFCTETDLSTWKIFCTFLALNSTNIQTSNISAFNGPYDNI